MAIEFARTHVIGRSAGHSAVRSAAYRAGERLVDARTGRTADYAHRAGDVAHTEILLPAGTDPALSDRTTLWTAVEVREDTHNRRASAQLALDHIVALPRELPLEQQIALARDYAQSEYVDKGVAVDLAVHLHSDGNPHAHLMTTTRYLDADGFGAKAIELSGRFAAGRKVADEDGPRQRWAAFQNAWLVERGIELVVTNHAGEYRAEPHLGPAHAIARTGEETTLAPARAARVAERTAALLARPEIVIERVSAHRSVFTRRDLYRETAKLVDDPEAFATIKAKLDASELLIRLEHPERGEVLTTRAVLETEQMIRTRGELLARPVASFALAARDVERAIGVARGARAEGTGPALSDEQRTAVGHLTNGARLGIVEGLAGAGKSTMLRAVRCAYEGAGHRVTGLALAGKAADELEGSSGIGSRTIHSWLGALERGAATLEAGEIVVVDEAGMVNNALMLRVMARVETARAKLVLVGDAEQLQPIEAGCPLRDLAAQVGSVEIATIRRQTAAWQRAATLALARGNAAVAVEAYAAAGHVQTATTQSEAIEALVADYLAAPERVEDRAVLAHRNADVAALNAGIRAGLQAQGQLSEPTVAVRAATEEQPAARLELGLGERVLFTKNDGRLGVRNGQLGTYRGRDAAGRLIVERDGGGSVDGRVDGRGEGPAGGHARGRRVAVDFAAYPHLVHGYAMTVHKAQGRTVERAFVLGSDSMDRHLGYVAMSRHRARLDVCLPGEQFERRSFEQVISQARRQVSALDLVRESGLEPEGAAPVSVPKRSASQRPPVAERSVERAAKRKPARKPTEGTELEKARRERAALETSFKAVSRIVDAASATHLERLERGHRATLERLNGVTREAREALARHDEREPRQGLFGSAATHRTWSDTREALERARQQAANAAIHHRRDEMDDPGRNQFLAREEALRGHPRAAETLRLHGQRVQAVERRIERAVARAPGPEGAELDRAALEVAFRAATRVMDAAAAAILERLEHEHWATYGRLNHTTREAGEALARHDEREPRQGLFGSAAKHRTWSEARGALERARQQAANAAIRYRREEMDDPKRNEVRARSAALREHPKEDGTLELHGDVQRGEQAHARFVRLEARRAGQRDGHDAREVLATERELEDLTRTLTRNAGFLRTLDRDARQDLKRVQTRSGQAVALGRERDRGRGMSR